MNYHKLDDTTLNNTLLQNLKTQSEVVIYYIQEMDIDMLELILDNEMKYQELSKDKFIQKLSVIFDTFKLNKNDKLIKQDGFCNSDKCENSCKNGYTFLGNHSKHSLNLIFEVEDGIIQDIHDCFEFKSLNKELNIEYYNQLTILNLDGDFVNGITSPF